MHFRSSVNCFVCDTNILRIIFFGTGANGILPTRYLDTRFKKYRFCLERYLFLATRRVVPRAVSTVTGRMGARAVSVRGPSVFPPLGRRAAIQIFGGERNHPVNQLALAVRCLSLSVYCPRVRVTLADRALFVLFIYYNYMSVRFRV